MPTPTELSLAELLATQIVGSIVVVSVLPWLGFLAWAERVRTRFGAVPVARTTPGTGCSRPPARHS
jgi:hypothetical protein